MANPFGNFRLAINDPNYFFGRSELISEVKRSPFEVRMLLGGRRLGKTSVLNAIRWTLLGTGEQEPNRALPVLFNLQQQQPKSLDHFLYLLIATLKETIENPQQEQGAGFDWRSAYQRFLRQVSVNNIALFGISLNVTNPAKERRLTNEDFCQDLIHIIGRLREQNCQGICFLFDGAEYIVKQPWANDAWCYLRSLKETTNITIQPFLGLFLSGYRDLKDYQQRVGSPLLNIAEVRWLMTLTQSETQKLIMRRCEDEKFRLNDKVVNTIIEWAGCHPYLTNQMLNVLFENNRRTKPLSGKALMRYLIRKHRKRDFAAWWDEEQRSYGFGELEQSVYLTLAKEQQATAEKLAEQVDLSIEKVEDALDVLAGTGVIRQLDYENYAIGSRLFEQWVAQKENHPNKICSNSKFTDY